MPIDSNTTFHTTATTSIPSGSGSYQTPSSINSQVEGVAFDALFSPQEPDTEKLRFTLKECGKTGSQYYTIVEWQGKKYRITVHNNKKPLQLSEKLWQDTAELLSEKVLNKHQSKSHFFKGTLQLHTQRKWIATYEKNKTPTEKQVSKSVIKEFKKLLEKEIPTKTLSAKSPGKLRGASYPSNFLYNKPAKKEVNSPEFLKKILEKIKNLHFFEQLKNRLFPSNNHINDFGDLSSTASISSFEEINEERVTEDIYSNRTSSLKGSSFEEINAPAESDLDDVFSDNTSLSGKSDTSSNVSNDSGSSYSPEIKR